MPTYDISLIVAQRLPLAGIRTLTCTSCGKDIFWGKDKYGKTVALDLNLRLHAKHCGEKE